MEETVKKELDNLINNWDSHLEKSYELFSKIQNWSYDRMLEIKKNYDKKISKIDLFHDINFTNLYECKKSGHILMLKFKIEKNERQRKENSTSSYINNEYSLATNLLLKLPKESDFFDVNYKGGNYKIIQTENLMKFSFRNYQCFNIDNLYELINEIDFKNIKFESFDEFSFESFLPGINSYNKYNEYIHLTDDNKYENECFKSYLEYKKKSSKKFDLTEKIFKKLKIT
jgi:hypothetical protein